MTKREKIVILSSGLLAVCVIASAIVFFIQAAVAGNTDVMSYLVIGIFILLGVLSVIVVYFLQVRKQKFEKLLNTDYYQKYEVVRDAIMNSQLSASGKKEIKEDVLDMLILAQNAGKPAVAVVENPAAFAQEILHAFAKPSRFLMMTVLDGIVGFVLLIIGFTTVLWLEQVETSYFAIGIDINMMVLFAFVAFLIIPVTKRLTATERPWMFLLPLAFGILFVLVSELLRAFFADVDAVRNYLDGTIRMIPGWLTLIVYILAVPLGLVIKVLLRKNAVKG
ncbi:MAG: hypothetical protein V1761_00460 [bacterium]